MPKCSRKKDDAISSRCGHILDFFMSSLGLKSHSNINFGFTIKRNFVYIRPSKT